jgi:hypothetical protein
MNIIKIQLQGIALDILRCKYFSWHDFTMSQNTPPTQKPAHQPTPTIAEPPSPASATPAHSKLPMIATVVAGVLSSIVSIVALTNVFSKSEPQISPTAKTSPASTAGQSAPQPVGPASEIPHIEGVAPAHPATREKLKVFWATLTPEQREKFKLMSPAERKAFKAQHEALPSPNNSSIPSK